MQSTNETRQVSDLEEFKRWRGKHTKHIVEVLAWDGTVESGGTAYIRRSVEGPYPYEYRAINLVDLLKVYDPLPNFPKIGSIWLRESTRYEIIDLVKNSDNEDNSWIIFDRVEALKTPTHYASIWSDFQKLYVKI